MERHKQLPLLSRFELLQKINELEEERDKALVSFLYLSGCRISEVVGYYIRKTPKKFEKSTEKLPKHGFFPKKLMGIGIKRRQIEVKKGIIIVHQVRCLKRYNQIYLN